MWLLLLGKQPDQYPPCATCGGLTRIVTRLPATRELAATHVFECMKCGVIGLMPGQRHSSAEAKTATNGTSGSL